MKRLGWVLALLFIFPAAGMLIYGALNHDRREGAELIGKPAPAWQIDEWINSDPLFLENLKGKVVLVRWWTDFCPFCAKSAEALSEFHNAYREKGLMVIGMYHPKPRPFTADVQAVRQTALSLGFEFPIGIDDDWKALNDYWLFTTRGYTSVSFVIDRDGIIRYVHPGPEFHPDRTDGHEQCVQDYIRIKETIETLLKG